MSLARTLIAAFLLATPAAMPARAQPIIIPLQKQDHSDNKPDPTPVPVAPPQSEPAASAPTPPQSQQQAPAPSQNEPASK